MTHRVAVIAGDGAGPEVVAEARKAVDALGLDLEWHELPWGSDYFHETGTMMPPDAVDVVREHDAVLLGAVGHPSVPDHITLWGLLLPLRHGLDLWANIRPARLLEGSNASRHGYVLWDEVVEEVAAEHPDVQVDRALVDALAARMVTNPLSLDVVVASNLFGDVLTDIAAVLQGGMELLRAIEDTCREGPRTRDIGGRASTSEVGDAVAARV